MALDEKGRLYIFEIKVCGSHEARTCYKLSDTDRFSALMTTLVWINFFDILMTLDAHSRTRTERHSVYLSMR